MSIIKGGAAGFKSVAFYSENFSSKAIRNADGTIIINISKRKVAPKFERLIGGIPFIRGLYLFAKPAIVKWKTYLLVFFPFLVFLLLASRNSGRISSSSSSSFLSNIAYGIQNHFLLLIAIIMVLFTIVIKLSNLGKYHGGEHMVDLSYKSLSSLAISDVVRQSRVHRNCGTNFVVFILVSYFVFSFFISNYSVLIIFSICLGYELYLVQSKVFVPLYWIGGLFQYYMFTSKPSKGHLEVAIAAYEALLREERKQGI